MKIVNNIEKRFKSLVEEKFIDLFVFDKTEDLISRKLSALILEKVQPNDAGDFIAPNIFLIITSPSISDKLKEKTNFLENLSKSFERIGREIGFSFPSKIVITTHPNNLLKEDDFQIIASFFQERFDETLGIHLNSHGKNKHEQDEIISYLILEGKQTFQLDLPTTNIGRRLSNNIVLDDARVSRDHAQIRNINGKFKIFDLNSKGGTFINDTKITQEFLYTGDVISCAGYSMIFIQDSFLENEEYVNTNPVSSK